MDISADVAAIVAQAPDWNFAGDCALLELMKRISQNLQERGEHTNRILSEFEINVRRTDIALDNATNSLRSLQFGQQFVEYRVEEVDDDDFAMPEELNNKPKPPVKSSQEMATEFLQNNLQMFRKNFEPVTIEVPDSDDEDGAGNTTTIFRAKNPYDAIPLPYIIGSKEWQEHKYAGLYDSAENSEDEQSEQFSSSSSDELEAVAPAATPKRVPIETAQLSDSSSLASLPKEPPIRVNQAPPSPPPAVRPKAQPRPIISSKVNPHERDMFSALRASPPSDDPPSTSSSLNSSPAISHRTPATGGLPRMDASLSSSSSSASRPMLAGRQSPPKLFDEPITVAAAAPAPESVPAPTPVREEAIVKPAASQIKRKPVNLFNDDEFNSFMSEIVDKVQSKSANGQKPTVAKANEVPKPTPIVNAAAQQVPPKAIATPQVRSINLFDDSPPLSPIATPAQISAPPPPPPAKTLATSVFDDLDDDDDFLSSFTSKAKPKQSTARTTTLFDDDDDDLDIDDIFAKKPKTSTLPASKSFTKTKLFDDDDEDAKDIFGAAVVQPVKQQEQQQKKLQEQELQKDQERKQKLEEELKREQELKMELDLKQEENQKKEQEHRKEQELKKEKEQKLVQEQEQMMAIPEPSSVQRKSIFDDLGDDDLFGTPKNLFAASNKAVAEEPPEDEDMPEVSQQKKQLPKETIAVKPNEKTETMKTPILIPKANLFSDDFSDEDEPIEKPPAAEATSTIPTKPNEITEESLPTPPAEPMNKVKEVESMEAAEQPATADAVLEMPSTADASSDAILDDLFAKLSDTRDAAVAAELQQDPIISLVAEVGNKDASSESQVPPKPADVTVAQQIMQSYSSLFSDEPPDDSEFFQSLGTSSLNSLSASKMFENEQDYFEPSLPELPKATMASKIVAGATTSPTSPVEQPSSDYGGIGLFSDVPPEDDGDERVAAVVTAPTTAVPAAGAAVTKRIHTIFYDDFSETARAQPEMQVELGSEMQSEPQMQTESQPKTQTEQETKGQRETQPKIQSQFQPPTDVVDKSIPISSNNDEFRKPKSPVKKLQMPNININVQALLPGAGALPKLPKKDKVEHSIEEVQHTAVKEQAQHTVTKQQEHSGSAETENILKCVGKTRARGPAHRRPSTRRARQENYAKSLSEEHAVEATKQQSTIAPTLFSNSSPHIPSNKDVNDAGARAKLPTAAPEQPKSNRAAATASFLDSEDDDDALFTTVKQMPTVTPAVAPAVAPVAAPVAATVAAPVATPVALQSTQPPEDDHKPVAKSSKVTASFLDSEDEDSGFIFSPAAAAAPRQPAKHDVKPPMKQVSFLDSDEDEDKSSSLFNPLKNQASTSQQVESKAAVAPASDAKIAKFSSFLNSEDDDEDDKNSTLFSPLKSQVASNPAAVTPAVAPATQSSQKLESKAPAVQPSQTVEIRAPVPQSSLKRANDLKIAKFTSFLDNEDDDDEFFGASTKPVAAFAVPTPAPAVQPKKTVESVSQAKPKASTLFDDSDDDDDDLFGSASAPLAKSQAVPVKPKASLFANSDEDAPSPKAMTSKVITKMPAKPSKSLFSDDEDDDDLFGGGGGGVNVKRAAPSSQAKPVKAAAPAATRNPAKTPNSSKMPAKPSPSSGNSDNPLADLLGP